MAFALQEAELWSYVTGARRMPRAIPLPIKEGEEVEETEEQLEKRDQRDLERLEFEEKQRRVVGKIGKMCTDDVQQEFLSMRDPAKGDTWMPKDLWEHLKSRYTLKHWSAKWATFNRLEEIDYEKCKSVEEYGSLVRDIKAEITDISLTVDQIIVLKLLNGLGSSFSTYLTILNEQARREENFPGLDELLKNLEDEESRMRQDPTVTANVLNTKAKRMAKKTSSGTNTEESKEKCNRCGKVHSGRCKHANSTCNGCGKKGHLESVCRSKDKGNDTKSKNEIVCTMSLRSSTPLMCMANTHPGTQNRFDLLLDSGATAHIICNKDLFHKGIFQSEINHLETGSGEVIATEGKGSLLVPLDDGNGNFTDLVLTDVLYSPRLKFNLISTRKLGKKGIATYLMEDDKPAQLMHKGKIIGLAKVFNDQYVLQTHSSNTQALATTSSAKTPIHIWHERLGHLSYSNLLKLNHLAKGVAIEGPIPQEVCGPCMLGRQQRKINRTPRTRSTELLGLIHSDLGGPLPTTRFGERYYCTMKDDFSGAVWVYLLKTKSQVFEYFKRFKVWIEKQTEKKIKKLRADGGGEYTDTDFQDFLKKEGISWDPRAPYTPEQNGKAERQNYTLMVPTRSMLKAKRLPKSLWGEILKTSAYIKNRSPGVDDITPYERLNNSQPFLGHLRAIGSRAWVHIPKEKRKKLDDRSWQGTLVGYEGNNQYRIYDPLTGKVHICRDVTVDENNTYDPKDKKAWDFADVAWEENDDALFDDPVNEFVNENKRRRLPSYQESSKVQQPTVPTASKGSQPMGVDARRGDEPEDDANDDVEDDAEDDANDDVEDDTEDQHEDNESEVEEIFRTPPPIAPRRSGRLRVPSKKALDNSRPNINVFRSNQIPKSHEHMVRVLTTLARGEDNEGPDEPLTLKEAMSSPYWEQWRKAMEAEYNSLIENDTWTLEEAPSDRKVISGRWVFKLKKDRYGEILKFKARWVVHGYKQKEGLDYLDTFATVVKPVSYKALMGISVKRGLSIHHMDVVTAFLYGFLDESIYVIQPTLFEKGENKVCLLRKALYGLKQSPRVWYQTLQDFLQKMGFRRTESDHGVFVSEDMYIAIYVDDLLIFGKNASKLQQLKYELKSRFRMTDLGEVSHYLGIEIDVSADKSIITLRQSTYLKKVLGRFNMLHSRPISTPMDPGTGNTLKPSEDQADKETITWYQSVVGSLMWPAIHTRPDIAYAVGVLSRYCSNPSPLHCKYLQRVMRYLAGTLDIGLVFRRDTEDDIVGYSDADYAGTKDGRRSTGAYTIMLAGAPISHRSKLQPTVAMSTCEAEYMALTETAKEAIWCGRFLAELDFRKKDTPVLIRGDNQGAIALAENPEFHSRNKHIEIKWHWIREVRRLKKIQIKYISTNEMIADGLTKPLAPGPFQSFKAMLGMI